MERFHGTLRPDFFDEHGPFPSLAAAQDALDAWVLARIGTRTRGEPHPQRVAEMLLQRRVVDGMRRAEASLANRRGLPKANAMDR